MTMIQHQEVSNHGRKWKIQFVAMNEVFELFLPCNLDALVYRTYKNIMSHKYDEKRKKAEG